MRIRKNTDIGQQADPCLQMVVRGVPWASRWGAQGAYVRHSKQSLRATLQAALASYAAGLFLYHSRDPNTSIIMCVPSKADDGVEQYLCSVHPYIPNNLLEMGCHTCNRNNKHRLKWNTLGRACLGSLWQKKYIMTPLRSADEKDHDGVQSNMQIHP